MRKLLVVLILLVISLSSVFAVTETTHEANLNIKAYKIGNYDTKCITLSVFDALVGDLDTIKKDDKIDITSYTKDLMNPYKDDSFYSVEPYADHVIFSLRISGNSSTRSEGRLKCTVEITPLQKTDENNGVIPTIDTYYEMRDVSCVFTSNYKTTTDTNGRTTLKTGTTSGRPTKTSNLTMDFSMTINVGTANFENWRALASVGVSIGNQSYDAAKTGIYYATVTIGVITE